MSYVTKQSRVDMKVSVISVFIVLCISGCYGDGIEEVNAQLSYFVADLWLEGADIVKILWRDCSKKLMNMKDVVNQSEYFPTFLRCMKRKTLRALDRSLSTDVVPVFNGINLVRYEMVDRTGNIITDNETSAWTEKELEEQEWRTLALKRMAKVLRTHVIKFEFNDRNSLDEAMEFRGRRRHHMMTMMMFGIVSIGMVLVPMGYQFLAVVGGKALVLAKIALILASIQGLKKIASSPVNYGYYHPYPGYEQYEKRSDREGLHPSVNKRNSLSTTTIKDQTESLPMGKTTTARMDVIPKSNTDTKSKNSVNAVIEKSESLKPVEVTSEPKYYPVYLGTSSLDTNIDTPSALVDFTTKPNEVQADYSLDFPYNRFRYSNPTAVVSA